MSIAGIVFPYRLPELWQSAGGRRVFGIPAVTLAGIGGAVFLGYLMFLFVTNSTLNATFAVTRDISLIVMGTVIGLGVLWYIGAFLYNRSRGIDVTLAYAEIPPE